MPGIDNEEAVMDATEFWHQPEAVGTPVDALGFLAVFLRRWPFMLALSLGGLALAFAASFLVTPIFTSQAVFLPPTQSGTSTDSALSLLMRPPSSSIYTGLLNSSSVLADVVTHTGLQSRYQVKDQEAAMAALHAATAISADASGFVTLAVSDKDPRLAQEIARNYLDALTRLNDRLAISEAGQRRILFQTELEHTKNDLENAEVALKRAQETSGVVLPEAQIRSGLTAIDTANADLRAKRVALSALLQGQTEQSPEVQRARSEIATEEGQLARLERGEGAPQGSGLTAAEAPAVSLRFVQLEREVKYQQVLFDIMAKQYETPSCRNPLPRPASRWSTCRSCLCANPSPPGGSLPSQGLPRDSCSVWFWSSSGIA